MKNTSTSLIHHHYEPPTGFAATQVGVFKASTVFFSSVAQMRARDWRHDDGYTYGLHGTPTTFTLQERLCTLEGARYALLVPSGLAAIANVNLALLKAGDEVCIPNNAYGPTQTIAQQELATWGIHSHFYDPMNPKDLEAKLSEKTSLVWLEAPGSITMEFPPLGSLIRLCKSRHIVCALDSTWSAGLAFSPFEIEPGLGTDISIHALTKYPSGGGDIVMGSITTRDEALHWRIKATHMRLGLGVGANDVEAILHALPSLELRYLAQDTAARQLAHWLSTQPQVSQVLHPAIPSSPGHAHWKATCRHAAGLFSFVFHANCSEADVNAFCERLKLFKLGYSWGGPVSLVLPYDFKALRGAGWKHERYGVRLAIGLEAMGDLQADLEQALSAFPKAC